MKYFTAFAPVIAALTLSGCGSSPATPTPTPKPSPLIPAGSTWLGEQTVTSTTGGECLASAFKDAWTGVPGQFHATFTRSTPDVVARTDMDHIGRTCGLAGSLTGSDLVLTTTGCNPPNRVQFSCPGVGGRELVVSALKLNARVDGDRITGTAVETLEVVLPGTSTSVGTLVANSTVTLVRQ